MSQMENIQCPSCGSSSFTKQGELIECNHCGNIYQPSQLQVVHIPDDPLEELQDKYTIKQLIPEVEELKQEFQDKSEKYERLKENFHEYDTTICGCVVAIFSFIIICLILEMFAGWSRLRFL